jgi:hypothetical protein
MKRLLVRYWQMDGISRNAFKVIVQNLLFIQQTRYSIL